MSLWQRMLQQQQIRESKDISDRICKGINDETEKQKNSFAHDLVGIASEALAKQTQAEKERDAYKKLATDIAVDRQALFNTVEYLIKKWGRSENNKELELKRGEERDSLIKDGECERKRKRCEEAVMKKLNK